MMWGDHIELSGTESIEAWARCVAAQLVDSVTGLEGLEDRPLTIGWFVKQGFSVGFGETLEQDRSHDVVIGACVDSNHNGS